MTSAAPVVVVAAVIARDGRFLLARRLRGTHLEGLWEFPGGKCEPGETRAEALAREIEEELGVGARVGEEILTIEHRYPDRQVRLHFHRCDIDGEPTGRLGQALRWVTPAELRSVPLPEADRDLVDVLCREA